MSRPSLSRSLWDHVASAWRSPRVRAGVLVILALTLALAPLLAGSPGASRTASYMRAPSTPDSLVIGSPAGNGSGTRTSVANPYAHLPKGCWPEHLLTGRDSVWAFTPCNALEVLPIGMRVQVECTLDRLRRGGWDPLVFETYRSDRRQQFLYSYGRTRPGKRVTNVATARTGFHHWGWAVDIIHRTRHWNHPRFFHWVGQHAEACGLVAGAFWKSFPDFPHVQFAAIESMSRAPTWAKRLMAENKRDSLWLIAGAMAPRGPPPLALPVSSQLAGAMP